VEVAMSDKPDGVEDIKALAERYRRVVQESNRGHYVAAERAEGRGRLLGIASVIVGAVVGTSIFATIQSSPSVNWRIAAGLLVTGATVLSALQTFLDYAKRAAEYRTAGAAYGRLRREFDGFLLEINSNEDRVKLMEDLSVLRGHIDELGQQSPLIPPRSYSAGLRQLSK
jgi:uncharacterized membrane protein YeaQ/YmgE (transglycosylase-associated protein family)